MAEKIEVVEEELTGENGNNALLEMAHKVLLAGIGVVALTQEEVEKFVAKLVERGEIAEKDGRKMVKDVMERRKKQAEEVRSDTGEKVDRRVDEMLTRLNVPTRDDIDALSKQIATLTRKVDAIQKAKKEEK
ncbi:MAG: phasin family protein [Candidatus Promineifilaceae bacterium]